jgi:hypothetical protein
VLLQSYLKAWNCLEFLRSWKQLEMIRLDCQHFSSDVFVCGKCRRVGRYIYIYRCRHLNIFVNLHSKLIRTLRFRNYAEMHGESVNLFFCLFGSAEID